jgi:putative phosphoribosyl transferase
MTPRVYADRREAGRLLADALRGESLGDGVVVGLARGGVAVAFEVARGLRLPLDALAVRKVGHPLQPEFAVGAVTPGGGVYLRSDVSLERHELDHAVAAAQAAAEELDRRLHEGRKAPEVAGRTCVLVDDGLATGATMLAAINWARRRGAARVVVAVPVGPPPTIDILRQEADSVICLETPEMLFAVGEWYADFGQVSDQEVIALLDEAARHPGGEITVEVDGLPLPGDLTIPDAATGLVLFAHGSGSGRHSPRNRYVAGCLNQSGLGTLLFDLLTPDEELDRARVFDIPLLAERLGAATGWYLRQPDGRLPVGYFGASTGAAAALWAAAESPEVRAVVSRGGRPDLAGPRLGQVRAPTLLIVGGDDREVLALNREAQAQMRCPTELVVVPGATHLFEEPGALEQVAEQAARWFQRHLAPSALTG